MFLLLDDLLQTHISPLAALMCKKAMKGSGKGNKSGQGLNMYFLVFGEEDEAGNRLSLECREPRMGRRLRRRLPGQAEQVALPACPHQRANVVRHEPSRELRHRCAGCLGLEVHRLRARGLLGSVVSSLDVAPHQGLGNNVAAAVAPSPWLAAMAGRYSNPSQRKRRQPPPRRRRPVLRLPGPAGVARGTRRSPGPLGARRERCPKHRRRRRDMRRQ